MLVAFTGKKYHGKDTASEALANFVKINFSDPVKALCKQMFFLTDKEVSDPILKQTVLTRWPYKTPRELMQYIGDHIRETFPDIWTINWAKRSELYLDNNLDVVITDLRYPNEEALVRELGGIIIKIIRQSVLDDKFSKNKSETNVALIKADYTFFNDRTPEELHAEVLRVVNARRAQS